MIFAQPNRGRDFNALPYSSYFVGPKGTSSKELDHLSNEIGIANFEKVVKFLKKHTVLRARLDLKGLEKS